MYHRDNNTEGPSEYEDGPNRSYSCPPVTGPFFTGHTGNPTDWERDPIAEQHYPFIESNQLYPELEQIDNVALNTEVQTSIADALPPQPKIRKFTRSTLR